MGSYYSVKDYFGVNPEFGTKEDFKSLVDAAHDQGFYVILDWVANHTAWDHPMATEHPDWYEKNWNGDFRPTPWWDWSDIIDLDFSKPGVRAHMSDAMTYWVEEMDVDGFRADVAGYVPLDFWEGVRARLDAIKPVFMLAEWQTRDLHARAFDATYAWEWKDAMKNIAQGRADTGALYGYYSANESAWPADAMRMIYTSNHDQNSWDGTPFDIYGDALESAMVLSFVGEGIPLIYNGQEAGNTKRLEFFEKDLIRWNDDHPFQDLFRNLIELKTDNPVLHNGAWGARTTKVENDNPQKVFSFIRRRGDEAVLAVFNFSDTLQSVSFTDALPHGTYDQFQSDATITINSDTTLILEPWDYRVYSR
ncbi:alpha-amylase family glycosyl hydrolase [Litorimonas sp. RW-G-Af-16]|uniref:alpha-amylase family glycosyl hydrolase n=1 Tax=Litorimonas sp. RW-G-Af-16 TaxID=3241168 RepID=UPI003AAD1A06